MAEHKSKLTVAVDTSDLDVALEKALRLEQLLDQIKKSQAQLPDLVDVDFCRRHDVTIRVFLDGFEQCYVTAANISEGWISRFITRPDGTFLVDGDKICEQRINGCVTAILA